jgi:hypothetical protein
MRERTLLRGLHTHPIDAQAFEHPPPVGSTAVEIFLERLHAIHPALAPWCADSHHPFALVHFLTLA